MTCTGNCTGSFPFFLFFCLLFFFFCSVGAVEREQEIGLPRLTHSNWGQDFGYLESPPLPVRAAG